MPEDKQHDNSRKQGTSRISKKEADCKILNKMNFL